MKNFSIFKRLACCMMVALTCSLLQLDAFAQATWPYIYATSFDGVTSTVYGSSSAACQAQFTAAVNNANKSCGGSTRPCIAISGPSSRPNCSTLGAPATIGPGFVEFYATQWFIYQNGNSSPTFDGLIGSATLWASCPGHSTDMGNGQCRLLSCPTGYERAADGSCKPKICPVGQVLGSDGNCVAKTCPAGEILDADGNCKPIPCPVQPLAAITDPDALRFERGDRVREDRLTAVMAANLSCLRAAIQREPVSRSARRPDFFVTSAWRPPAYQLHLREIKDKLEKLKLEPNMAIPACTPIRITIQSESDEHQLGSNPVALVSRHTQGIAFDASWTNITDTRIDALATGCGVSRAVPGDRPHFQ